jgi:hypothetical protein
MLDDLNLVLKKCIDGARTYRVPRRPDAILKHPEAKTTGNLKYNALKTIKTEYGYKVYIDLDIAPYMPYTNEEWISPKWNGAKNPNEKWFENMVLVLAQELAMVYNGIIKKD